MTALQLPFAQRRSDGVLVSPDEVPRGMACACICSGCKVDVIARQGPEREWHFAHAKGATCAQGYEISIHELAKQLLRLRKQLLLPALIVRINAIDAYGSDLLEQQSVFKGRVVTLDSCKVGQSISGVNVDVVGIRKNRTVLVEISVFHRLMPEKQQRIIETGLPSFQININQFKNRQATRALLENALFEDDSIRQWIYHPKQQETLIELQTKLNARIQASRSRWDTEQAIRHKLPATKKPAISAGVTPIAADSLPSIFHSEQNKLLLSAALPAVEQISIAARRLSNKTGVNEEKILDQAKKYTSRAQLQSLTPDDLVETWGNLFNIQPEEIIEFLKEAGYIV